MSLFRGIVIMLVIFALAVTLVPFTANADYDGIIIKSDKYPMRYENADGSTVIEITKERHYGSNCFVAHIVTSNPKLLRSCFAKDNPMKRGRMTKVARDHDAIFMINADWSFAGMSGNFVIRNGEVVKPEISGSDEMTYFCIMDNGHLKFIKSHTPSKTALKRGVYQSFTFYGGNLFKHGKPWYEICRRNPHTFIGEVPRNDGVLEYVIVVADGRSHESKGLHHGHEAMILYNRGCNIGYNLDGGGSSEMVFDGKILNVPSDGHERRDHDFIYVKLGD